MARASVPGLFNCPCRLVSHMRAHLPIVALVGLVAGLALPSPAWAAPKVYVAPYAPVNHSLPAAFGVRTARLISGELKAQKKVEVVDGPSVTAAGGARPLDARAQAKAIGEAERQASKADAAMKRLRFKAAVKRYRKALADYEKNLVYLDDFSRLVDTRVDLAVALFRTHQENEGEHLLAEVIALDPDKKLDPQKYPPLFRRTYQAIRKKLLSLTRCASSVVSTPAGAEVFFDGKQVGKTPLLLKNMVRGLHFVKVVAPGAAPYASQIHASPASVAKVDASLAGSISGPAADLVDRMARGRIDRRVLKTLGRLASKAGADYAIIGGVRRASDAYAVRSWIYDVHHQKLAELPDMSFDVDMLGAAIEVYKGAAKIADAVSSFPEPVELPVTLFPGASRPHEHLSEVDVGPAQASPEVAAAPPPKPAATVAISEPTVHPARHGSGPVQPASGPVQPASGPVQPSSGPVQPSAGPVQPASGPIVATRHRRPAHPVIDQGRDTGSQGSTTGGPVAPQGSSASGDQGDQTDQGDSSAVVLGGPRARTLNPDATVHPRKRYAAVDVDQVVAPSDELDKNPHHGWPWWAWGLLVVGVGAAGAGGYFAADKAGILGGSASSATVTVTWPK